MNTQTFKKDIPELITLLETNHPNPFKNISKQQLTQKLQKLSNKKLDNRTFIFELTSIISKINDSHTRIKGIGKILTSPPIPIRIKIPRQ